VDWLPLAAGRGRLVVDRLTDDVEHPAQGFDADRHRDTLAGVDRHQVALQAVGGTQRDATDHAVA